MPNADTLAEIQKHLEGLDRCFRRLRREHTAALTDLDSTSPPFPEKPAEAILAGSEADRRARQIIREAEAEWRLEIREPPAGNGERIDRYIRGEQGLGWSSADASNLGEPIPYQRNGQFAWCGAFAAYVYGAVGLRAEIRRKVFPSTYRLHRWAQGTDRWVDVSDLKPGDVCIVGPSRGGKPWGNHVTIVRSVEDGGVATLEGNAKGVGPQRGERYEGVIVQFRPFASSSARTYVPLFGVRPREEDYE